MVSFLYNFAWTLILILSLPLILLARDSRLSERLAFRLPPVSVKKESIWIHALSVGEVISVLPLIRSIRQKYPSKAIVLSVKTSQGMKVALDQIGDRVDTIFYLPLDFWWATVRLVRHIRPSLFILVESDIWPGLIFYLKKIGVKSLLVNGRVSPRTFRSYKRFGFFTRLLFNSFDLCLMQSDLDRERLLGTGTAPEKTRSVGNIKFDRKWRPMDKEERYHWLGQLHLRPDERVWVAGSTHEGEEEIVLETFKRLVKQFPGIRLVIAPRKPERADEVYKLSSAKGFETMRRTDSSPDIDRPYQVLILDTIGELGRIYGLADISFVGGSMVPVGGHNLLEPASFGCPVLFGIHTHNFVLMSRLLIESGGGKEIKDAEDLFMMIKALLSDPLFSERMAEKAREFVKNNCGAVERVMGYIGGYIET